MHISHVSLILLGFMILSCGLAVWKGGEAERLGGAMIAADWLLITLAQTLIAGDRHLSLKLVALPALAADVLMCFGFLWLVFRHGAIWLGAALLVQGLQLAVYAAFIAGDGAHPNRYAVLANTASFVLLDILLLGVAFAWWGRVKSRRRDESLLVAAPA